MRLVSLFFISILAACLESRPPPEADAGPCEASWHEADAPVIATVGGAEVWNDPTVLAEDGGYRMWLSRGNILSSPIRVETHVATSVDGTAWTVDPTPVLAPGPAGAWDETRIETASVVKRGAVFHLYYSGCDGVCEDGIYAIGHATSVDGVAWVKDPANPVIVPEVNPARFGTYTAAEPGAVVNPSTEEIFVYYTGAGVVDGATTFGLLLATSADGSAFTHHADDGGRIPVLLPSARYPAADGYWGYSTPAAAAFGGEIHLYHDVVKRLSDVETFGQVAIASAHSTDGRTFVEDDEEIVTTAVPWHNYALVSPTVVAHDDVVDLWFAGFVDVYETGLANYTGGIGRTTLRCD